ncbi:MAG TPA: ABC transporter permease [Gemmatimonadaceae bacterium]
MSPGHPPGWRRLLRLPLGHRSIERDIDDELAFHLVMREEKLRRLGLAPDAARAGAQDRFGDTAGVRDECLTIDRQYAREVRLMEWLESLWTDFQYALRTFRRMPTFTAVATITLALGIGATTAMFTLVNSILLRPLPYPESDRIVRIIQSYPEKGLDTWGLNQMNIAMYRDRATDFSSFAAYRGGSVTLQGTNGPQRVSILRVTAEFFRTLGVGPAIGRPFTAEEDSPGKNTVMILSDGMWRSRFGGDLSILGKTIDIDGQPIRVVGVMPASFAFPRPGIGAYLPMGLNPLWRFGFMNSGIGRLKPGIAPEHAERQTTAIMWDWARQQAVGSGSVDPSKTRMKTIVRPLHEVITGRTARPLTVLLAAVALILLIATANVATLLSGRATTRQREITLRAALGASRRRVLRQLLTESVALALLGALAGVALAVVAVRLFTHSSLATLPRIDEVAIDGRVLAFALVVSITSGLLFGLLPAIHAGRARLTSDLTAGQRESSRGASRRVNNALVVAQLSLSVVLLIAAGLVLKSFQRLTQVDLGFHPEGVTSIVLPLPPRIATDAARMNTFVNATLSRVRAVPGVQTAALTWALPMGDGGNYDGYLIDGRPVPASGNEDQTYQIGVSPEYFKTVGIPLLYGRDFAATDDSTSVAVGIVDATLANRFWKGADALGKRIRVTGDTTWFTIVGVAGTVRDGDPALPPEPHLYVSIPQVGGNPLSLAIRTNGSGAGVIPAVRRVVAEAEPGIPLDDVRALSTIIDQTFATRRLTKLLLGGFALVALLLAAVGIYGVMSLHVANRSREFGIRLAIGADPRALVRLVLGEGAVLAALGVGVGIGGAMAVTRSLASLLYDVSPTDPAVLLALPLLLAGIALAACYAPARRAARSDPLITLRAD